MREMLTVMRSAEIYPMYIGNDRTGPMAGKGQEAPSFNIPKHVHLIKTLGDDTR